MSDEKRRAPDTGGDISTDEGHAELADRKRQSGPRRILLVEDEMLLALVLEDMVVEAGYTASRAARLSRAMELVRNEQFAAAVLDVNVAGEPVFPLAALLRERGIPFCFATGYGLAGLEPEFRDCPVLQKPYGAAEFNRALQSLLHQAQG
jgi:DNA-binding response OmpR family regulator